MPILRLAILSICISQDLEERFSISKAFSSEMKLVPVMGVSGVSGIGGKLKFEEKREAAHLHPRASPVLSEIQKRSFSK